MCKMVIRLSKHANNVEKIEVNHPEAKGDEMYISNVTHPILVFIEKLIL